MNKKKIKQIKQKIESKIKEKPSKTTFFDKVTHVYLQEKYLTKIPKLRNPLDIQVIYLYSNCLKQIENLKNLLNLTCLYLQNNEIEKIENLENAPNLKKLFLGKNKISVVENLECMGNLEELHVEKQKLEYGSPLCFDPRTIFSLTETLQILNISQNKITSLTSLKPLRHLAVLDASCNYLDDVTELCEVLKHWPYLQQAKFLGNPISKKHRYREEVIGNSYRLEILDDKNISELQRTFMKRFEETRLTRSSKQSVNLADVIPGLPQNYPLSLQKAASASLINESRCKLLTDLSTFDEANAVYITWNNLPKRRPLSKPLKTSSLKGHKMSSQNILISGLKQTKSQPVSN